MVGFSSSFLRYLERSSVFSAPLVLVFFSSAILILVEYATRVRFSANVLVVYGAYWVVLGASLLLMTHLAAGRLRHEDDRLMVSIFVAGFVIGLMVATYKVIAHQELWTVFNLFAEPMRTALVGLVVSWLFIVRERGVGMSRLSP